MELVVVGVPITRVTLYPELGPVLGKRVDSKFARAEYPRIYYHYVTHA